MSRKKETLAKKKQKKVAARDEVAPRHGWDYVLDVELGKRRCQQFAGFAVASPKGLEHIVEYLLYPLRHHGISRGTAVNLVMRYAECPFERWQIEDKANEVYDTATCEPGLSSQACTFSGPEAADEKSSVWGLVENDEPAWPKPIQYDSKQHAAKCAETFRFARPKKLISSDGILYSLDGRGIYHVITEIELAAEIRATDPTLVLDTSKIMSMVKSIHIACFTKARPFEWLHKRAGMPLAIDLILAGNGVLDFTSGKLFAYTGDFFVTGVPTWDFDPDAKCPLWEQKLNEWLHPSFHPALQEFFGYCLTPDTSSESFLALIGTSRGGKGTITRILQALIGPAHHASRTLNDLSGDFGLDGTLDKRLIIIPDAHDTDVSRRAAAIERIKCITGRDDLSINRKNMPIINATVPAKLLLVANKHPKFLDESGAFANREVMMVFQNTFIGREDRELGAKLLAELPGIANWAFEGLRRLRSNRGKFTIGAKGRAAARELAEAQSPALRFANECLTVTSNLDDYVSLDDVYEFYERWADHSERLASREKRNRSDFKADLSAALSSRGVQFTQRRWHDPAKPRRSVAPRVRGFFGIKLKRDRVGTEFDAAYG